jgi:hypothetical protein
MERGASFERRILAIILVGQQTLSYETDRSHAGASMGVGIV